MRYVCCMLTSPAKSFYGRYSYRRQLWAEIFLAPGAETALLGIFLLSRIFEPPRLHITLLFALNHMSFLAAPWIAERIRSWSANKVLGLIFLLSVPPLFCAGLLRGFWGVGPLLVLANTAFVAVMVPLRNRMMRANYLDSERGGSYGRIKAISTGLFFGVALAAALRLTEKPDSIYWMLPILALTSAIGLWRMRQYRVRREAPALAQESQRKHLSTRQVYGELLALYRNHHRFRSFEIGFMIYGLGFMLTIPQEIAAISENVGVTPVQIVIAVHGLTPLFKILVVPFFGRLMDLKGVAATAAMSFLLLALYPLAIWAGVATGSVLVWFAARAVFGAAMAGVDVCWSLGPVMFGGEEKAARYSAAHIFAVGIRAAIVPVLGFFIYRACGTATYALASVVLVVAALHMSRMPRHPAACLGAPPPTMT